MVRGLIPWRSPLAAPLALHREMDSLLERFFGNEPALEPMMEFAPAYDVAETPQAYEVTLELPGLKPEDINVEWKDGQLWITGEKRSESKEDAKTYHRVQRRFGQFRHVVTLDRDLDAANIAAEYTNGVLKVTVPKTPAAQPRRIEVKS